MVSAGTYVVLAYAAGTVLFLPNTGGSGFFEFNVAEYLNLPHVPGVAELAVFAAAIIGAGDMLQMPHIGLHTGIFEPGMRCRSLRQLNRHRGVDDACAAQGGIDVDLDLQNLTAGFCCAG